MDLGLKGKIILVTGSTRGIGLGIAKTLHREGAEVIVHSRSESDVKKTVHELGEKSRGVVGNVEDIEVCKRIAQDVKAQAGRLDALVCNVGSGVGKPPGDENAEELRRQMNLNFFSTTNTLEACRPLLAESKGAIVCISSICGLENLGAPVGYHAAKSALNAMVVGLSRPLAKDNIRINAVAPGHIYFEGGSWDKKLQQNRSAAEETLEKKVALKRFGTVLEVADACAFLLSPKSSYTTGSILVVDGGTVNQL